MAQPTSSNLPERHPVIEVVNDLSIQRADAGIELPVFLDGGEIGTFEIIVGLNAKRSRIHINQSALDALDNTEAPFLEDQAGFVRAADITRRLRSK